MTTATLIPSKRLSPSSPEEQTRMEPRRKSVVVTPTESPDTADETDDEQEIKEVKSSARRKLVTVSKQVTIPKKTYFGRYVDEKKPDVILDKTRKVYKIVNKMTGSIGGNGCGGAIYGELTVGSMQKMIELMKVHTDFGPESRFIDVGSGLGKPNLHVAQDPGVEFSYGIEMEHVRWVLGMSNLNMVLKHAKKNPEEDIRHRCMFQYGDITEAKYFDPFTHVYMFDIGFPPRLFKQLAEMFNQSHSPYLICYHAPRLMIDRYGFNVELIVQMPTSMHGSSENHMGYIYRRVGEQAKDKENRIATTSQNRSKLARNDYRVLLDGKIPCDPLFVNAWNSTRRELAPLLDDVKSTVAANLSSERPRRTRRAKAELQ